MVNDNLKVIICTQNVLPHQNNLQFNVIFLLHLQVPRRCTHNRYISYCQYSSCSLRLPVVNNYYLYKQGSNFCVHYTEIIVFYTNILIRGIYKYITYSLHDTSIRRTCICILIWAHKMVFGFGFKFNGASKTYYMNSTFLYNSDFKFPKYNGSKRFLDLDSIQKLMQI